MINNYHIIIIIWSVTLYAGETWTDMYNKIEISKDWRLLIRQRGGGYDRSTGEK